MSITIMLIIGSTADEHQRTCAWLTTPEALEVYIQARYNHQRDCQHHFVELGRFGDGHCATCEVLAWSAYWVADGVFGESTDSYIEGKVACYAEQASVTLVAERLGGEVIEQVTAILAEVDEHQPAMLHGRRGSVPTMAFNVTGVQS